jgi:dimethylargininase
LVRPPGPNFASGLTHSVEGPPDVPAALAQHSAYCDALRRCGLSVTALPADPAYPDGTFVEDTAVLFPNLAIITRPGAASRRGETGSIESALRRAFENVQFIREPGTIDGGDVCAADDHVFIGVSARTNQHGAAQLAQILKKAGRDSTVVDIRASRTLLHLKSGVTWLGGGRLVLSSDAPRFDAFKRFDLITLRAEEDYAANCLVLGATVLIADGYPEFASALAQRGFDLAPLNMSEFRKMDGGLTCLSLRY